MDPQFGVEVSWDIPLLDGYPWIELDNRSPRAGIAGFWGLVNPSVWTLIRDGRYDAVVIYTGYMCATFWIAFAAAKFSHTPLIFASDATEIAPRDKRNWKRVIKRFLWPKLFRIMDTVIVPSRASVELMLSLGISNDRIKLTPYTVDNEWWTTQVERVNRAETRKLWGISGDAPVVLFCAKLQPWKCPQQLLQAFAAAKLLDAFLVYAGDGPMRSEIEAQAIALGVRDQVRFLGFVNQSGLPAVYGAADLLVLPSIYEPFGVVVNEAMLCGCPVVVSDRVGARLDLVRDGETGFVYPSEDRRALAGILHELLPDMARLRQMGRAAKRQMVNQSPEQNIDATVQAIEETIRRRVP